MDISKMYCFNLEELDKVDNRQMYESILVDIHNSIGIVTQIRNIAVKIKYINDKYLLHHLEDILQEKRILKKIDSREIDKILINKPYSESEKTRIKAIFWSIKITKKLYFTLSRHLGYHQPSVTFKIANKNLYHTLDFEQINTGFAKLLQLETQKVLDNQSSLPFGEYNPKTQKPLLGLRQIALLYAYQDLEITKENSTGIAKKYNLNSGQKLYQHFLYYRIPANRKGEMKDPTRKKLENKIRLISSVINLLPTEKKGRATDELSILKNILETYNQK